MPKKGENCSPTPGTEEHVERRRSLQAILPFDYSDFFFSFFRNDHKDVMEEPGDCQQPGCSQCTSVGLHSPRPSGLFEF